MFLKDTPKFLKETIAAAKGMTDKSLLVRMDSGNDALENDIVNIPLHIFLKIFEMFCIGINPHGA